MSGDDYSETVTKLITSRPIGGLKQKPDEPKPTLEYPPPTMQNPPYIQSLPPSSTPEVAEPATLQIAYRVRYVSGELNVARTGKMYATLVENLYSHLKEHTSRENYSDREIINMGLEFVDAVELLLSLGKATDEIVAAGLKARESALLMDEALEMRNRASELFRESLSLLRSMNFEQ